MSLKSAIIGCVLAGTAVSASALTLGRSRGAAWIGQSLELVVPVQLDAGQTDSALCAEADVFHADSRQDSNRIRLAVESTAQADTFNIRISSSALVDEPVVTVYLRAGCSQKTSRKFVLLADYPSEANTPLSRTPEPNAPQTPLAVVPPSSVDGAAVTKGSPSGEKPVADRPPKRASRQKEIVNTEPVAKKEIAASDKKAATAANSKPASSGKPRLKLDPLENLTERIKTLEATTVAVAPDASTERDAQRMEKLQGDVRALLEQAAKNEANLAVMRERMERAESERVSMGVVYGLLALVLLCMGALAYLWSRRNKGPAWDHSKPTAPFGSAAATTLLDPNSHADSRSATAHFAQRPSSTESGLSVDVNLMDLDEEAFSRLMDPDHPKSK